MLKLFHDHQVRNSLTDGLSSFFSLKLKNVLVAKLIYRNNNVFLYNPL